jgi:transcriptional regulator with XRE-family HTH domain
VNITSLAERVKVKRLEKRLNQAELAKRAGLTQATISRLESGEITQLKSDKLMKLAKALDVTVDFLVGRKERMTFDETLTADETAQVIFRGFEKLSDEARIQVKEFVEFLIQQRKSEKK